MWDEIIVPFFTGTWGRRLCWMALVVASVLLLVTLIKSPMMWYSDHKLSQTTLKPTSELPEFATRPTMDLIQEIPSKHLFGNSLKPKDSTYLPITSLQLRLIGIVQAIPNSKSNVIISEAGQTGKVYQVGEKLPMGVKVDAITGDGVILENAGRLEKLPLQRQPLAFSGRPKQLLRED